MADDQPRRALTMRASARPVAQGAHLVGSVPLASAEVVFQTVGAEIGDRLRRIPDGETGPRSDWIVWQLPVFTSQPRLEVVPPAPDGWRPLPRVRLEDGARAEDVRFEALGYADAAIASYRVFARLKRDGRPRASRRARAGVRDAPAGGAAPGAARGAARSARGPVGHELRVRHARGRVPGVVRRRQGRHPRAAASPVAPG